MDQLLSGDTEELGFPIRGVPSVIDIMNGLGEVSSSPGQPTTGEP